jgi:hypothetical protein
VVNLAHRQNIPISGSNIKGFQLDQSDIDYPILAEDVALEIAEMSRRDAMGQKAPTDYFINGMARLLDADGRTPMDALALSVMAWKILLHGSEPPNGTAVVAGAYIERAIETLEAITGCSASAFKGGDMEP